MDQEEKDQLNTHGWSQSFYLPMTKVEDMVALKSPMRVFLMSRGLDTIFFLLQIDKGSKTRYSEPSHLGVFGFPY